MTDILQSRLPFAPWTDPRTRRLPGILPLPPEDWLRIDDAYAPQMAERDRLIAARRDVVHALSERGRPAAEELLETVLGRLEGSPGFSLKDSAVVRPDGVAVPVDRAAPLVTLGRLCQEDFCILERAEDEEEHVLTGAVLCFPASWTLDEKFMQPLIRIHRPVAPYDADVARRVQRLFDAIRPGQGLWRANALHYADAALHQPRREDDPRTNRGGDLPYIRSEYQTLVRLPESRAVVFGIHTYMVHRDSLTPEQAQALRDHPIHKAGG